MNPHLVPSTKAAQTLATPRHIHTHGLPVAGWLDCQASGQVTTEPATSTR